MDLKSTVNMSWRQEAIIKSLAWNSAVEVFKERKNIDISDYLWSIQLKKETILIKTTKSILKSEMILFDDQIKKKIEDKLKKVGIKFKKMEIKYI